MNILAIDPATRCGWAHSDGRSGSWRLATRTDVPIGARMERLRQRLDEFHGLDLVAMEGAFGHGKNASGMLVVGQLAGMVLWWAWRREIPVRTWSPAEIKKFATGKGNAPKDAMLDHARRKWPNREWQDDNECDARWLLELASQSRQT